MRLLRDVSRARRLLASLAAIFVSTFGVAATAYAEPPAAQAPDPIAASTPAMPPPFTVDSEAPPAAATPRVALRYNLPVDLTVTGTLGVSLIVWAAAIKPNLAT